MATIKQGYACPDCGTTEARIWWSREQNNLVASCVKCGAILQVHDESMYVTSLKHEEKKYKGELTSTESMIISARRNKALSIRKEEETH